MGIMSVLRLLILSSMTENILFFHSQKLQMLRPLLEESFPIYSCRPINICVLVSFQDTLTGYPYLGPLETISFNLALDIILRSLGTLMVLINIFGIKLTICTRYSISIFCEAQY